MQSEHRAQHDLVRLADDAIRAAAPLAATRGVHLGRESSALSIVSLCDRQRVERRLGTLLERAIEHTPRGGAVSVCIGEQRSRRRTTLVVQSEPAPPPQRAAHDRPSW